VVNYNIIFHYIVQKMNSAYLTIEGFAGELATAWGMTHRERPGETPVMNRIPLRHNVKDIVSTKSSGPRYILSMKRLTESIMKGNIVMVINEHFRGGPQPKCVSSISTTFIQAHSVHSC
jgi:hypothetical protein